jgi:hypothetical protein
MNASNWGRYSVGAGGLVSFRSALKLMLLPSSLPAQAASAIGSKKIVARFAKIPKCNPSSKVRRRSGF